MSSVAGKQSVAVIGGGLAGLSAAVTLAKHGISVTLFERSAHPGGRAQTTVKDGYHINFGPHALYLGNAGVQFLKELGIEPTGNPPPAGRALGFFKGKTELLPLSLKTILSSKLLGIIDKIRWIRLMSKLDALDERAFESMTVNQWIESDKDIGAAGPRLKGLVRTLIQLSTYTGDMDKLSAEAGLKQLKSAVKHGVIYLHGGWTQMVNALLEKARIAGVEIVSGCEVAHVGRNIEDLKLTLTTKDNAPPRKFDGVIFAVPPEVVNKITAGNANSEANRSLNLQCESLEDVKAACLDVCLKELPRNENTFALGIDEPLYYSVHSKAANLTPDGGALIHLAYYLKGGESGSIEIEKRLERVMDSLQPGWRDKLVYKRFLANIVVSHKLLTIKNGKLGGYWSEETPEVGVYRAGDWVGTHQLADGSLGSAKRSSELLLGFLTKQQEKTEKTLATSH